MRYSLQHRKAFGEAFDFLNGRDVLRLLISIGAAEVRAGAAVGRHFHPHRDLSIGSEAVGALAGLTLAAGQVSIAMGLWAIAKMSHILLAKMRRPQYYQQERNRRERLARERRRVHDRFTIGSCPKPEDLLAQYARVGTGVREALRFGSMLCDLEAFCDNSLLRNADGEIVGRNPGMKGWIRDNCPELLAHYKNVMHYKGLAEKFRQAAGAADPLPATALLTDNAVETRRLLGGKKSCKITVRNRKANGLRAGRTVSGTYALEEDTLAAALGLAREILEECGGTQIDRLRCGTNSCERTLGKVTAEEIERLRCRTEASGTKDEGRASRVGVAKLERILNRRLGEMPPARFPTSKWRIVSASAVNSSKRTSA